MNDLNRALSEISNIRRQMAQSTEFRGYGPATLAGTGLMAVCAAAAQWLWLRDPAGHIEAYLAIWIVTAFLSAALIGAQMYTRSHRMHSGMADEMIRMAVEQFLPSMAAGALMTMVLVLFVPASQWMIPGVWQVILSVGVFSSCRFLPRLMAAAGAWYLVSGLCTIALADNRALSPLTMGVAFGVGQLMVATILYFGANERAPEAENLAEAGDEE